MVFIFAETMLRVYGHGLLEFITVITLLRLHMVTLNLINLIMGHLISWCFDWKYLGFRNQQTP